MADSNGKDDLKTQFLTREGIYRLLTLSEYSRPKVGYQSNQSSPQVRVSLVTLPSPNPQPQALHHQQQHQQQTPSSQQHPSSSTSSNGLDRDTAAIVPTGGDRICFNIGKELLIYAYRGVKKASDLNKPIDKKLYKGTNPSCHDFNSATATCEGAPLLVGFSTGQIQLVYPGKREQGKLYNEERLIDKTKVTSLKWIPGSTNLFLASHSSGNMYLYNEELPCSPTAPTYQAFKSGDGYAILTCKSKSTRNPLYKWSFCTENSSINEICFSPCGSNLAIVSQDGFLRVFHYDTMELLGLARSYFGGFLCVCWSPDGKYIVVGGEDDLVTVYSLNENRVVARGQGHRSWVSVVAFDPYTTSYSNWDGPDFSDDENPINDNCYGNHSSHVHHGHLTNSGRYDAASNHVDKESGDSGDSACDRKPRNSASNRDSIGPEKLATSYRLGSVSQDTQLCLWDITEDILRQPFPHRTRLSSYDPPLVNGSGGGVDVTDDIKVLRPIASSVISSVTDNCSIISNKSNTLTRNSNKLINSVGNESSSLGRTGKSSGAGLALANCIGKDGGAPSATNTSTISSKSSASSSISAASSEHSSHSQQPQQQQQQNNHNHHHNHQSSHSAFNAITQRLTNFSFSSNNSDSKTSKMSGHNSVSSNKRNFTLSKSIVHHHNSIFNNNHTATSSATSASEPSGTLSKHSKYSGHHQLMTPSYDPMKLIGTPSCPRFDEVPVLEPLVCKKIAHERLTALIFREDCFLTACQDGFVYTWARPGYVNMGQHNLSPSPSTTQGGTVV